MFPRTLQVFSADAFGAGRRFAAFLKIFLRAGGKVRLCVLGATAVFCFSMKKICALFSFAVAVISIAVPAVFAGTLPDSLKPEPQQRDNYNWAERHAEVTAQNKRRKPDYVFFGDSITHFWGGEPKGKTVIGADSWEKLFRGNAVTNCGFGFDYIDNAYYRAENGELDGVSPRVILVNLGTNNIGHRKDSAKICAANMKAFVALLRKKQPKSKILLIGVYPRREAALAGTIAETNRLYAKLADRRTVFFANPGKLLLGADGKTADPKFMRDVVHLNAQGYRVIGAELEKELGAIDPAYAKTREAR